MVLNSSVVLNTFLFHFSYMPVVFECMLASSFSQHSFIEYLLFAKH